MITESLYVCYDFLSIKPLIMRLHIAPARLLSDIQKEFNKEFGVAAFTWNGGHERGIELAKQSRKGDGLHLY